MNREKDLSIFLPNQMDVNPMENLISDYVQKYHIISSSSCLCLYYA